MSAVPPGDALGLLRGKRLLVLNWRCPEHPLAGGAETFAFEVAKRFVGAGADVTYFTARPRNLPGRSVVDGVRIIRRGRELSVYVHAAAHVTARSWQYDAIIDCQNGIPFFAPLFAAASAKVVGVVHHVHQDQFRHRFRWPMTTVGRLLEGPVSRAVYGHRPFAVVSPSTRLQVRRRLALRGPLFVVPNGAFAADVVRRQSRSPMIVSVGRLVPHKRTELLLAAVPRLRSAWPGLRVEVIGDGPERPRLEAIVREQALEDVVTLHGFVPRERRDSILASAWVSVNLSDGEGWGLGVIEANSVGVPVVARPVAGLRDSVVDEVTGWLTDDGDLVACVDEALRTMADPAAAASRAARCTAWAAEFSWDMTARRLAGVIAAEILHQHDRRLASRPGADLATLVRIETPDPHGVAERAAVALRPTDLWSINGQELRLLLHGCDEHDALTAVARLGVTGRVSAQLATSHDLLVPFDGSRQLWAEAAS